jgi:hypothetical protein
LALRAGPAFFTLDRVEVVFLAPGGRPAFLVVLAVALLAEVFFLAGAGWLALPVACGERPLRFAAAETLADRDVLLAILGSPGRAKPS